MIQPSFQVVLLGTKHDRAGFHCESDALNRYLKEQVTQDMRRRVAACFVALTEDQRIAGYYTLASASVMLNDLPISIGNRLPRYPSIPAIRMGRLAVDQEYTGQGLGGAMLADALERAVRSEIAAYALVVDAKDKATAEFYLHHGFMALPNTPLTLFLPLATVRKTQN